MGTNIHVGPKRKKGYEKCSQFYLNTASLLNPKETMFVVSYVINFLLFILKLSFYFSEVLIDLLESLAAEQIALPVQQVNILKQYVLIISINLMEVKFLSYRGEERE